MSWLFGLKSNPPAPNASDILGVDIDKQQNAGGKEPPKKETPEKGGGGIESNYSFDSSALERAAQAAKDLEKSSHAKEVSLFL